MLSDLVHLGEGRPDTRRRRSASDLRRAGDDGGALAQVLDHLSARRLIAISAEASEVAAVQVVALQAAVADPDDTAAADGADDDPDDAERHVDLAHDTLITGWPALAGWIRAPRRSAHPAASRGPRRGRRLARRDRAPRVHALGRLGRHDRSQVLGASDALRALVRRNVRLLTPTAPSRTSDPTPPREHACRGVT